jgi:hypothetical protein
VINPKWSSDLPLAAAENSEVQTFVEPRWETPVSAAGLSNAGETAAALLFVVSGSKPVAAAEEGVADKAQIVEI